MKQVPIFQILLSSLNSTCIMKHNMVDLQVPVYSDMCIGAISMFPFQMALNSKISINYSTSNMGMDH